MGAGPASQGAFVGRAAELALLAGRAEAARRGDGGVALIGGEPGIGKTRLAAEAAALATSVAAVASRPGMLPLQRSAGELAAKLSGSAPGPLTRRESEIATLIARGLTNRQLAALHISERTAENHVQHILTKLGLHTRTQIAVWSAGASWVGGAGTAGGASPEP